MRRSIAVAPARRPSILGLLLGGVASVAVAVAVVVGTAVANTDPAPAAVLEATHLPPLLVMPGEPVELAFEVHCAHTGVEDPEKSCRVGGSLYLRRGTAGAFRELPLTRDDANGLTRLTATVPDALSGESYEYFAEIRADEDGGSLRVPSGPGSTYSSYALRDPVEIGLTAHPFGATRRGERVVAAAWGDGPAEVGLEPGRNAGPIGASSFDVDTSGAVVLLDEAHRRALRFSGQRMPLATPLATDGRLADLALGDDGSVDVLESLAAPGRNPLVRRFDHTGRQLDAIETAERSPSQIRSGPEGPVVLEHPSHEWMPIASGGSSLTKAEQVRHGRVGRPVGPGVEVIVLRTGHELRLGLLSHGRIQSSWRLTSAGALGEVQLAEPLGNRLVVVVRTYDDHSDEFRVLLLDRDGLVRQFAVDPADWAETAPLSRFRLVGGSLYQLGSDPAGAFVDRYDLEVR